jgi:D-alanyl-D-alanine carboxypeptidase
MPAVNARPNRLYAAANTLTPTLPARGRDKSPTLPTRGMEAPPLGRDFVAPGGLTESMVMTLQRLAGNSAVATLLQGRGRSSPGQQGRRVQRATLGWSGAESDSWNKGEISVTAEGKKAAAGEAGILRIPVSGIDAGRTGPMEGESGGGSDPNIGARLAAINAAARKAAKEKGEKPPPPVKELAVSEVTSEAAGGETGGEAILVVPTGLRPGPVDVLIHLHGHTIGYRQARHGKGEAPPPRDVQYDRIEQQLLAASKEGTPMLGILPQGSFYSKFGPGGRAGLNADAYIDQVFALGVPELKGLTRGRVTLSGWSGAGAGISEMIAGSEAQAAGRKVPGGKTGALLPSSDFEGLFLFDAIYGKRLDGWLAPIWRLLQSRLKADLAALTDAAGGTSDAAAAERKQLDFLAAKGFRFRGIYTEVGGCVTNYEMLRDDLLDKKWFQTRAVAALPSSVQGAWHANYQVQQSGKGVSHNEMIGKQGGPNQENLLKAIEMLPKPAAPAAGGAAHGRAAPVDKDRPAASSSAAPRVPVAPAMASTESVTNQLIDAAASLGRAGNGSSKPKSGTLLRQEDVRSALENRSKNATLNAHFTNSQAVVEAAAAGPPKALALYQQASGLVRLVELQFILNPQASAIDLLPPDRAKRWKDFKWDPADYPGGPKGKHEGQALAMMEEMTTVRAERRPNIGSNAVITKDQMTPEKWAYIRAHSPGVKGEDVALFQEAGESFARMREAAKTDGVHLKILSGWRDPVVAAKRAKKAANPYAIAKFSSHSLGLAADLELWGGKDDKGETYTGNMQKVFDMRATPVHKWMVFRGEEFGWYPYGNEPWHWEYNPPGLKERFFKAGGAAQAPAPAPQAVPPVEKPAKTETKASAPAAPKAAAAPTAVPAQAAADGKRLSGKHWVDQYDTSRTLDDLKDPFKGDLSKFIDMLKKNGAHVEISATYRPPQRAWLMHWAWVIANGGIKYSRLGRIKNPYGVDIVWDHGTEAASRAAAAEMVSGYHMAHIAALKSRHTERRAVDMTITHAPKTLVIDGEKYPIGKEKATKNEALWMVGQMFKVVKLASDPPHWSDDGH